MLGPAGLATEMRILWEGLCLAVGFYLVFCVCFGGEMVYLGGVVVSSYCEHGLEMAVAFLEQKGLLHTSVDACAILTGSAGAILFLDVCIFVR